VLDVIFIFAGAALAALVLVWLTLKAVKKAGAGQFIREEGPSTHQTKVGTPTMGGIGFLLAILFMSGYCTGLVYLPLFLLVGGFAALGFSDDILKVINKRNLGLTFWQKIFLQTLMAGAFSAYLTFLGYAGGVAGPLAWLGFSIPIFYFLLSVFILVGSANAANLTDGLDGLLAGCALFSFLAFSCVFYLQGDLFLLMISISSAGAMLGFLFFNFPKAKIFMGDVGSLSTGALLAGLAVLSHLELLLIVFGLVFVIEALSVIIQVFSYKLFKKRVFKMSPLHHHFEQLGWPEKKVVLVFWFVQFAACLLGVLLFYALY